MGLRASSVEKFAAISTLAKAFNPSPSPKGKFLRKEVSPPKVRIPRAVRLFVRARRTDAPVISHPIPLVDSLLGSRGVGAAVGLDRSLSGERDADEKRERRSRTGAENTVAKHVADGGRRARRAKRRVPIPHECLLLASPTSPAPCVAAMPAPAEPD